MKEQVKFQRVGMNEDAGTSMANVTITGLNVFGHKERHFQMGQHRFGEPEVQALAFLDRPGRCEYERQIIDVTDGRLLRRRHRATLDILHPALRRNLNGHWPQTGRRTGSQFAFPKTHLNDQINRLIDLKMCICGI